MREGETEKGEGGRDRERESERGREDGRGRGRGEQLSGGVQLGFIEPYRLFDGQAIFP